MSGLPSQLTFLDLALVLSPPIVLVSELLPALENCFGCISELPKETLFKTIEDMGTVASVLISIGLLVLAYAIGHVLLGLTDLVRMRFTRKIFESKYAKWLVGQTDPFAERYTTLHARPAFDRKLRALNGMRSEKPRTCVWDAAGFVQQHGNYMFADRFNTMAIYSFSISTVSFVVSIVSFASLLYSYSNFVLGWSAVLLLLSMQMYRRALQFHGYFTVTVMTAFVALPVQSILSGKR